MSIIEIAVFGFILSIPTFCFKIIEFLKKKELCPCFIKVPFAFLSLLTMSIFYFYLGADIDYNIWGVFILLILIGNIMVGYISVSYPILRFVGIFFLILSYIYSSVMLYVIYGIPSYLNIFLTVTVFFFYTITMSTFLDIGFKETWYEFLYSLFMFIVLALSFQEEVGIYAILGITLYVLSEIFLQISRMNSSINSSEMEYDTITVFLVGVVFFTIPRIIYF